MYGKSVHRTGGETKCQDSENVFARFSTKQTCQQMQAEREREDLSWCDVILPFLSSLVQALRATAGAPLSPDQ